MSTISLPIESQVMLSLDRVSDDATKDLRKMVGTIDKNMADKEKVRSLQRDFEAYKNAVRDGNDSEANRLRQKIYYDMADRTTGLGLDYWNSVEGKAAWQLPSSGLAAMSAEDRDKLLNGSIKSFESLLESRAQSLSDLGQKLQFQLQEANNIYTRANKAISDISQKYDGTLNGIAQNLKG